MALEKYNLTSNDGVHKLTRQGAVRASAVFEGTKRDAVQQAAGYMKTHGGSMRIHNETDGRISEERTYPRKDDPRQSPG